VKVPVLETERLLLREWHVHDRAPFAHLNADPVVMEHFPATMSTEESDAFVDSIESSWSKGFGLWAVEERATSEFIGYTGFASPSFETSFTPCIEIGWRFAAHTWGAGRATEAARAAIEWATENLRPPRDEIVSFTTTENHRSRRVMEKIGLVRDEAADFDHPRLPHWEHKRHVLYRRALDDLRHLVG
jgi:RimJ/RimL family protein N-acetyltransferase